jgi:hypothetical protein
VRLLVLLLASALAATPVATSAARSSFPPELSPELDGVLTRYMAATRVQRDAMLGAQMELDIDGRLSKLRESGRMRVLRSISKLGEMVITPIGEFIGDNRIRTQLIARYLETEEKEKAYGAMSITNADYDFKIKAILKKDTGRSLYIFDVNPRRKGPTMFRGEVWVDGATGMPLREAGQFVKSPHILLSNIRFVRDYELQDGVSIVKHFSSSTDVHLLGVGTAELNIEFSKFSRDPASFTTVGQL